MPLKNGNKLSEKLVKNQTWTYKMRTIPLKFTWMMESVKYVWWIHLWMGRMWWVHTLVSLWMSTTFSANWCWLEFCNWIKLEMLKMWWGMNKTLFLISLLINCCLIYLTSSYFKLRHECSKKMEEFNLKTAYLKIFPLPTFFFVWREITTVFSSAKQHVHVCICEILMVLHRIT